jgi:hypothetical protein
MLLHSPPEKAGSKPIDALLEKCKPFPTKKLNIWN